MKRRLPVGLFDPHCRNSARQTPMALGRGGGFLGYGTPSPRLRLISYLGVSCNDAGLRPIRARVRCQEDSYGSDFRILVPTPRPEKPLDQ